jgi:hypothetical protein
MSLKKGGLEMGSKIGEGDKRMARGESGRFKQETQRLNWWQKPGGRMF